MIPVDFQRQRIAIHEAGHAVCALDLGLAVNHISVRPDEDTDGRMCPDEGAPVCVWAHVVTLLAGMAAEQRGFGGTLGGERGDLAAAKASLARCHQRSPDDPELDHMLERLRVDADRLIAEHWPWIKRTASVLLRRQILTGAEVLRLRPRPAADPGTAEEGRPYV